MDERPELVAMGTTSEFKYYREFPFCVETVDLSALDPDDQDTGVFLIRGLTREDAMKLYWQTEELSISWSVGSTTVDNSGTNVSATQSISITADGSTGSGSYISEPYERVCFDQATDSDWLVHNETVLNGETIDGSGADVGISFAAAAASGFSVWPIENAVFIDENGDYCMTFQITPSNSCTLFIGSGGKVGAWANNLGYIDVSILSGTVRIHAIVTGNGLPYVSGGSLASATITPSYYTFV